MKEILLCCVLSFLFSPASAEFIPSLPCEEAPECVYEGHPIKKGETYKPDPCTFCSCFDGEAACAVADCFFEECVDSVTKPDECCPTCPNGPNCRTKNGTTVSKGQVLTLDDGSQCRCPEADEYDIPRLEAVCRPAKECKKDTTPP